MLDLHDAYAIADRMLASGSTAGGFGGGPPERRAAVARVSPTSAPSDA